VIEKTKLLFKTWLVGGASEVMKLKNVMVEFIVAEPFLLLSCDLHHFLSLGKQATHLGFVT
jgi:hypothetical protein